MPHSARPPGTGANFNRARDQRGTRRVFLRRPPPPLRRPPHVTANGHRGEGGSGGGGARRSAGEEAGGRYTRRGGVADREVAVSASADPVGRNAATVATGGEAPPPREEDGGGRGGVLVSKRPSAAPVLPPPKRRAVSVTRQFPPASRWTSAAPAPLAGADADGGLRTRYEGQRENRASDAFKKPAVARPLAGLKDGVGVGVMSRAVSPKAAGTRVLKKPCARDGAAPMSNTDRHDAGLVKSSAAHDRGRGARIDELRGKKGPVTGARFPPKPEIISTTRTLLPGHGKDGGCHSKVHRPLESGRAHGSSLADGRAVEIVAACTGTSAGAVQDGKLENGEVPSKKAWGSQVSSDAVLLDPASYRDVSARDFPGLSGNFGRKTLSWALVKDRKVMNKYGRTSYRYNTVAASFSKNSSKKPVMGKIVSDSGRINRMISSDVAAEVSGEGTVLGSKDMFTNQSTVKPDNVVQKFVTDAQHIPFSKGKKETVRERWVTTNGIQDSVELTKDRVMQAPMSADMCPMPMTHKKKAATTRDFFGHKRMVKAKALGHQQRMFASGSKSKRDDEVASNLKIHDIFREIVLNERNLELYLNSSSGLPSVRCQRQYRYMNADARSRFKMLCRMFEFVCRTLVQTMEQRSLKMRIDNEAAKVMKALPGFTKHGPIVGQVPGVEVGDEFLYRAQLAIAGLHSEYRRGISTTTYRNGMLIAISIVASGGYPDELGCSGELIYTGSGGKSAVKKKDEDQKLKCGNLALKNCIKTKTPVRVIHGFKCRNTDRGSHSGAKLIPKYTYDGLYLVVDFWMDGKPGSRVFKYKLKKIHGQPELPMHIAKRLKSFKSRPGLCMTDISQGKEATPICVINTVDDVQPGPFQYTTRIRYPFGLTEKHNQGCDCTNGCSDSESCACAVKNGGEIPFDLSGAILNEKSVIFECGSSCKCPPSCRNRVSQHDMKIPLEVFRTTKTGWGVRSLWSIPAGSFICEYIGEVQHQKAADKRRNNNYLFDVGLNYDDENVSSVLLSNVSGLNSSSSCSQAMEDVRFTIDASVYGNIGRFINHSCSPNLQAQNVLRDHGDKRMPHIMFFAAETIPPLQELTYDYNNSEIDRVQGVNRRMKSKVCQYSSSLCRRRFY
uniref:Histone-lysine N-methyltransferase H3 lysine-9 specific SUVH5 n=2 Tax=Zea mays TaxID=4577 RepID=A0A804LX21_MAIZE